MAQNGHILPQNGPKCFFPNFFVCETHKAMWKTWNVLFKVRIAAFPAYLWQRIDQNGHNEAQKAIFIVFVVFFVILFGLRAYTIMVTYHCWVPRSSRCSYSVFLCKWELFNDIRRLNGYFEAHMPILSRPVLISVINNQAELLVLWLPIIGEYLVHLGALIRSFYRNGSQHNPQNGPN